MSKIRLSVTVDAALAEAAEQLVNAGAAESLSAEGREASPANTQRISNGHRSALPLGPFASFAFFASFA